jgi:predicted dienelactone hydrolase
MRPIEILLSLTNVVTFLILVIQLPRGARWMRYWVPIALLPAAAQVLVEGPRWQMAPAYVLAGLFALVWLLHRGALAGGPTRHPLINWLAGGLGVLGLVVSMVLPMILPVFRFPPPGGPYGIGTVTYHWVDLNRPEIFSTDPNAHRELMVQIWYPARKDPSAARAPYMADAEAVLAAFARIHQKPEFIFGHFTYVTTNAISSAPIADDQPSYPVLLFLEGATGFRQMSMFHVEELVSHGYIVAAIDQPGAAVNVVFPDGHQVAGLSLDQMVLVRQSYIPAETAPLLNGRAFEDGIIPYLTQDVLFTLDQLTALNQADPNRILTGRLDMQRVGIFGVSLGGIVVGDACRLDPRLQACLMLDAPMTTDVVVAGLQQPSMWITRDVETMRLERQRAGGWSEEEIHAHLSSMRAVYQSLQGAGYFVQVPGMFHSNYIDVPNWVPLAAQIGLTGPIDGQRAHDIVNAYSLAFFDQHLKGHTETLLLGPVGQYPDVRFETHQP